MTDEDAPVIRWVNNLFFTAVKERAATSTSSPTTDKVVVRYRIDGKLCQMRTAPTERAARPSWRA
jgi:general secretion pathway protein E